jgi:hypothetical protein
LGRLGTWARTIDGEEQISSTPAVNLDHAEESTEEPKQRTGKQTEDLPAKMKQKKKTDEAVTGRAPGLRAGISNT